MIGLEYRWVMSWMRWPLRGLAHETVVRSSRVDLSFHGTAWPSRSRPHRPRQRSSREELDSRGIALEVTARRLDEEIRVRSSMARMFRGAQRRRPNLARYSGD
ncbi:hypothetical protein M6B38_105795 [Iris pallida]|uniref:Uncharacterized protein n=1 Tax=Iris pallida TaxID=29817 RepID=A0AAX6ERX0_IRIPA|nr:hypothetical protein M6B38_105795 [Iris pallida]